MATPPRKFSFTIFTQSVFVICICILVVLWGLLVKFCEFFLEALVLGGEFAVHDLACVKGVVPFFDFAFELPGVTLVFFDCLHYLHLSFVNLGLTPYVAHAIHIGFWFLSIVHHLRNPHRWHSV